MEQNNYTNRKQLTEVFYKTADALQVRIQTHERYTQPVVDFTAWVLDWVAWQGGELVLDVGCGAGAYAAPVLARGGRYLAADLSYGMVAGLTAAVPKLNLDAQRLPIAAERVDMVLANHMLYHVPDKEAAVAEFWRVLRPGGYLLATTNSATNLREIHQLRVNAFQAFGVPVGRPEDWVAAYFRLESGGELIGRVFTTVVTHVLDGALVFPQAQPVLDYLISMRAAIEPDLVAQGRPWAAFVDHVAGQLQTHFAQHETFVVGKKAGLFIGRKV